MIRVKISTPSRIHKLIRQTPNSNGLWKNCKFFIDKKIKECDFWIVYEGLLETESVKCPKKNTILITGEPPSVKKYNPEFLNQFSAIITCHKKIKHNNVIIDQQALPWRVGTKFISLLKTSERKYSKSYNELKKIKNIEKTKNLSVIISDKKSTKGHKLRYEFAEKLKKYFKDKIDIYGTGINPIPDKWDAIAPYKYHIAIENSIYENYWTEKLSDTFLGLSYPIYHGCPNIYEYFPKNSLSVIDIGHKNSIQIIEEIISSNRYEIQKKSLTKAKNLVLDKYNLFSIISNYCNKNFRENLNHNNGIIIINPEVKQDDNTIKKFIEKIYAKKNL